MNKSTSKTSGTQYYYRYLLDQKIKMLQNEKTAILDKLKEKEQNLK